MNEVIELTRQSEQTRRKWLVLMLTLILASGGYALSEESAVGAPIGTLMPDTTVLESVEPMTEHFEELPVAELRVNDSANAVLLDLGATDVNLAWDAIAGVGGWRVLIYNQNGTIVFDKMLEADRDSMTLDISKCSPGVYEAYLTADYIKDGSTVTVAAQNTFEVRAAHQILTNRMDVSRQLLTYIDESGNVHLASGYNGQEDESVLSGDISWQDWKGAVQVAVGSDHLVCLTEDGTVLGAGGNGTGQLNCVGLMGVRWIAAISGGTACVMDNGTVQLFGTFSDAHGALLEQVQVSRIDVSDSHAVVLYMDGTAKAFPLSGDVADNVDGVEAWSDLQDVSAGYGYVLGLKRDGTVLYAGPADSYTAVCGDWTNVNDLSAGNGYALALKNDGTVLSAGNASLVFTDTSDWRNIIDVAAGYYLCAGLRSDGGIEIQGD